MSKIEMMEKLKIEAASLKEAEVKSWYRAAKVEDFPINEGACVKYKDLQVAVFRMKDPEQWYACQNLCPHRMEMVLSRGMIGDRNGIPKVACPMHKKNFSLETGENLDGDLEALLTFPVKVMEGFVYIGFSE